MTRMGQQQKDWKDATTSRGFTVGDCIQITSPMPVRCCNTIVLGKVEIMCIVSKNTCLIKKGNGIHKVRLSTIRRCSPVAQRQQLRTVNA